VCEFLRRAGIGSDGLRAGHREPDPVLHFLPMVGAQGMLGYGLTSVIGAIPAEIVQGRQYGVS
jgi:hypothetical protein